MTQVQTRGNEIVRRALSEMARVHQDARLARIMADPKANKLTLYMADGKRATYRYFDAGRNKRGDRIRYCYTCWRNAAGYFLSFREVRYKRPRKDGTAGKRDQWAARKVRKRAAALARKRAERFRAHA